MRQDGRPRITLDSTAEFAGVWISRFETSQFIPCDATVAGSRVDKLRGERIWLDFDDAVAEAPRLKEAFNSARGAGLFLRLRGTLTGPGRFGHLGAYGGLFQAFELLEVRPAPPGCSQGEDNRR